MNSNQPIGIFDSGVGGLTVFREIRKQFPFEDIVYFGDTARVPYGPKSKRTIIDYSIQNARFLLQNNVKIVIIACNTSSAHALDILIRLFDVPVIGVIQPGAETALKVSKNNRIGVIGTEGTIRSMAYKSAILGIDNSASVISRACPLFVSLVEEGWENHDVSEIVAREYLTPMLTEGIDTLVLGCTHYPILKPVIKKITGDAMNLVDSAEAITEYLDKNMPRNKLGEPGKDFFFVSDNEEKFKTIASRILDREIDSLNRVRLGEVWYVDMLEN